MVNWIYLAASTKIDLGTCVAHMAHTSLVAVPQKIFTPLPFHNLTPQLVQTFRDALPQQQ
jgi:hypothetical protein